MQYRIKVEERDLSGFAKTLVSETGAMVVHSPLGTDKPIKCQSENDVLKFGTPSSKYNGLFEALQFVKVAPLWLCSALGDGYRYAGVDVKSGNVTPFGNRTGRLPDSVNYTSMNTDVEEIIAIANGLTGSFAKTLSQSAITENSLEIIVGSQKLNASESGGSITGSDITSGSLSGSSFSITLNGTVGSVAEYVSKVDIAGGVNLSGVKNRALNLNIDGKLVENIDLGNSAATTRADIITALNNAIDTTLGETLNLVSVEDGGANEYIKIAGTIGDASLGKIRISNPTDSITFNSAVNLIFDSTAISTIAEDMVSVSPTGSIPKANQVIKVNYIYNSDEQGNISHSFFTSSPYDDSYKQLAVTIRNLYDSQGSPSRNYKLSLYEIINGELTPITDYEYSLDQIKNDSGKSIYIFDVFKNNDYLVPVINEDYTGIAVPLVQSVKLTGGNRGAAPTTSSFYSAWQPFKEINNYPVDIFMDIYGNSATTIESLLRDYQPYAFGITCVPLGYNAQDAVDFRQAQGINYDNMAMYANWAKIKDVFNDSYAWTSQIGKVGAKYALMDDVYNALAPAGVDENNHGGILYGFKVVEVENDYKEDEKSLLDNAQINPILKHRKYGIIVDGDKTLQTKNSDTSFIGTRRLYNLLIDNIVEQVLFQQVFKLNDQYHRTIAQSLTEDIIMPPLNAGVLREAAVVCDESNNTDEVLNRQEFAIDVIVKVTPTSEQVKLRLTRLSQTQYTADFIS